MANIEEEYVEGEEDFDEDDEDAFEYEEEDGEVEDGEQLPLSVLEQCPYVVYQQCTDDRLPFCINHKTERPDEGTITDRCVLYHKLGSLSEGPWSDMHF